MCIGRRLEMEMLTSSLILIWTGTIEYKGTKDKLIKKRRVYYHEFAANGCKWRQTETEEICVNTYDKGNKLEAKFTHFSSV